MIRKQKEKVEGTRCLTYAQDAVIFCEGDTEKKKKRGGGERP